ncbi:hypothetical protein ACHAXM_011191 [Skeletonema potamos]|jgi:hypothetical protein
MNRSNTDSYEESIEIELPSQFKEEEGLVLVDNNVEGNALSNDGDDASPNVNAPASSVPRITRGKCLKGCVALVALLVALAVVGVSTRSSKNVVTNGTRITASPASHKPKASKAPHLSSSPKASTVPKAKSAPVRI